MGWGWLDAEEEDSEALQQAGLAGSSWRGLPAAVAALLTRCLLSSAQKPVGRAIPTTAAALRPPLCSWP